MAYSLDFRTQVFKIKKQEDLTFQETSVRFGITIRTLFRWNNHIEPKGKRDKPATKIDMKKLAKDVKKHPDAYQYERADRFGISQSAIYYALKRLGVSVKKNASSSKS